jgi:hypothetical protein
MPLPEMSLCQNVITLSVIQQFVIKLKCQHANVILPSVICRSVILLNMVAPEQKVLK